MVRDTSQSQDSSTHQIWNSYLEEYRRYGPDTKAGLTDGRTVRLLYASQSSFGGIKIKYTETIKLCPLDVYVCQFQMYERISFKFSPYNLQLFKNDLHLRVIHLIIRVAADKAANTRTLKIKSHTINRICVYVSVILPNNLSIFKHH